MLRQSIVPDGGKTDLEIFGLLARALRLSLSKPDPEAVFAEIRSNVLGYNVSLEKLRLGEAVQTRLAGFRPDQVWDSAMIEPAQNTLFKSGTLGRYSKVLGNVLESPGSLYTWSRLGTGSSGPSAGNSTRERQI